MPSSLWISRNPIGPAIQKSGIDPRHQHLGRLYQAICHAQVFADLEHLRIGKNPFANPGYFNKYFLFIGLIAVDSSNHGELRKKGPAFAGPLSVFADQAVSGQGMLV